jgi:hypothetical protein
MARPGAELGAFRQELPPQQTAPLDRAEENLAPKRGHRRLLGSNEPGHRVTECYRGYFNNYQMCPMLLDGRAWQKHNADAISSGS